MVIKHRTMSPWTSSHLIPSTPGNEYKPSHYPPLLRQLIHNQNLPLTSNSPTPPTMHNPQTATHNSSAELPPPPPYQPPSPLTHHRGTQTSTLPPLKPPLRLIDRLNHLDETLFEYVLALGSVILGIMFGLIVLFFGGIVVVGPFVLMYMVVFRA